MLKKILFTMLLLLPTTSFAYSNNDWDCLSLNIYYEARFEKVIGQYATGFVTLNRARYWHQSICHVVFARNQFSWVKILHVLDEHHHLKRKFWPRAHSKLWLKVRRIAKNILEHPQADFTMGAQFFIAKSIWPRCLHHTCRWAAKFVYIGIYGTQMFFRKHDIHHVYGV